MSLEKGKETLYNDEKYIILSLIVQDNTKYAFANKMDKQTEEPTDEYCIFKNEDEIVLEESLINKLLPTFQEDMKKDLESILD